MNTTLEIDESVKPFVRVRVPDSITIPVHPRLTARYFYHGPDDPVEITSLELDGLTLDDRTLAFFKRFGFDMDELAEHIHANHPKADPDRNRD